MNSPISHLYFHIPFCHKVCPYCSFYKHTFAQHDMAEFVQGILEEVKLHQRQFHLKPKTIFFGGGTPTALSTIHLRNLLEGLYRILDCSDLEELCLEANPRTVSLRKAQMLKELGVHRISLGVQAWDIPTLKTLGRDHLPGQAEETFHNLKDAGIPSLNLDFMFSIPGQPLEVWNAGILKSLELGPDHLSCYNLTYEEDTEFLKKLETGELDRDADRDADHFLSTIELLENHGFEHYEISNFAKPGHRSKHNSAYWKGADYLGIGPSATSTVHKHRWKNLPDTQAYLKRVFEGVVPAVESEDLTDTQWLMERVALELRTTEGIRKIYFHESVAAHANMLEQEGLLEITETHVRLTRNGKALADRIAEYLIPD